MKPSTYIPQCMQQVSNATGGFSLGSPMGLVLLFVLMLLFVVVVSLIVYLMIYSLCREPVSPTRHLDRLKERLAEGEVSVEDFDAAKTRLI